MIETMSDLTVKHLQTVAQTAGIEVPKRAKKADLVSHIEASTDGRRAFYKLKDRLWAEDFITQAETNGKAELEAPPYNDNPKTDSHNMKLFFYKVNAVVALIKESHRGRFLWEGGGKTDIHGNRSEPDSTFRITLKS